MKKLKVALTGATGFVGHNVLNNLIKNDNFDIVAVIRPGNSIIESANISSVHIDISEPKNNMFELMGKPDVLIHLAWEGLPNYQSSHHCESELPRQYLFLKNLVEQGLKFMVITGTCFEYGMQEGGLSSKANTRPNNSYGHAKDALRAKLQLLQVENSFKLVWARLFYLYGEGQSSKSLFSQLELAVKMKRKKFNMSGGEQLRDYLPVDEAAKKLVKIAQAKPTNRILNICSGKGKAIKSIVEDHIKSNNWDIELNLGFFPYLEYEPMEFWGIRDDV
jgi:nucleoside-diphosphate-sugar epimerase